VGTTAKLCLVVCCLMNISSMVCEAYYEPINRISVLECLCNEVGYYIGYFQRCYGRLYRAVADSMLVSRDGVRVGVSGVEDEAGRVGVRSIVAD